MIGLLVLAQALDALTLAVYYSLPHPAALSEQNPLVLALMALGGVQLVALVKVGVALAAARRSPAFLAHRPRLGRVLIAAATLSGVIGAGMNAAAIAVVVR